MSLFPLDAVRNAGINQDVELVLEDIREEIVRFPFSATEDGGDVEDALEVFDLSRPRLNVLASLVRDMAGQHGADIGTGFGFLPVVLHRDGVTAVATEKDDRSARFAQTHGVEVRRFTIGHSPAPFEPGSLSFVIFAEVLEHLKLSPVAVLRDLGTLLRPGGRLLLTTPNIARLHHLEALASGENFLEPFPEDLPGGADPTDMIEHVREYSIREVVDAIEAAGLEVNQVLMTGWGESGYRPLPNPYANEICVVEATR